jgi:ribosome-associated protein
LQKNFYFCWTKLNEVLKVKNKRATKKSGSLGLNDLILQAIQDKKGEQIVSLDLRNIKDAVADYFIICEASSTVQVKAIADHVMEHTQKTIGEKPWHNEGMNNMEWVLIDYVNVVVHVFLKEVRRFYQLEELWSDATILEFNS